MKVKNKSPWMKVLNSQEHDDESNRLVVSLNRISVKEDPENPNVLMFSRPLTITDNKPQYNGTRYDIASMNIDGYRGLITIDHSDSVKDVVGRVLGLKKTGQKVTIDGIDFAVKENPIAQFTRDMMAGGYATDVSIETIGPWPDEDGVYKDSSLVGLSIVIVGNNQRATVNSPEVQQVVLNSIEKAKQNDLDCSVLEKMINSPIDKKEVVSDNEIDMKKFKRISNGRSFAITVEIENALGEKETVTLQPNDSVICEETVAAIAENTIKDAKEPAKAENDIAAIVTNAVAAANKPLQEKIAELEQKVFDNGAKEPKFTPAANGAPAGGDKKYADMGYKQRHSLQINAAWELMKDHSQAAGAKLLEINKVNFDALQEKGIVDNSITIADMGNFVFSPELIKDVQGFRSNYQELLSRVEFIDTLSLQMAYLERNGDIDMDEVEMCDDDEDGNLKPIKEYGGTFRTSNLKEVAAVTPICDAATRFLAVDLLGDVAQGYRTAWDRKKAQLLIARLQQAVDETGYKIPYLGTSDLTTLKSWANLFGKVAERVTGGLAIFNENTRWELVARALGAGISGPNGVILSTGDLSPIFGKNYVVVPNDLMPTLNTNQTRQFVVEGVTVTINQAVLFFDPSTFAGRTSGGLKYDFSTDASYEVGDEVRSAFQRNELVVRGSGFRGGVVKDKQLVSGLYAAGVS